MSDLPLALWILVTVRPWAPVEIRPVWQRDVHPIERRDELFGTPQTLKGLDDLGLSAGLPGHLFMGGAVSKVHATLEADRKVLGCPGTGILFVESKFEVLQPLDLFVAVVLGTFRGDDILDQDTAILVELIAPITVDCIFVESNQVFRLEASGNCALLGLSGGGHSQ